MSREGLNEPDADHAPREKDWSGSQAAEANLQASADQDPEAVSSLPPRVPSGTPGEGQPLRHPASRGSSSLVGVDRYARSETAGPDAMRPAPLLISLAFSVKSSIMDKSADSGPHT